METILTPLGARILGCLIEKETTTPEYYPLSLNALVNACNQKSNREPVMNLSEAEVDATIDVLKEHHVVWKRSVTGARVYKYEHNIKSLIALDEKELAILCVLLLRGPQTVGELRLRTERLCTFSSLEEVEKKLHGMITHEGGAIVRELPRQPGRKESRFVHLLCGEEWAETFAGSGVTVPENTAHIESPSSRNDRIGELEASVHTLQQEVLALRTEINELKLLLL